MMRTGATLRLLCCVLLILWITPVFPKITNSYEEVYTFGNETISDSQRRHLRENSKVTEKTRTVAFCSSNGMSTDAFHAYHQIRTLWKSDLHVTIVHCGELPPYLVEVFEGGVEMSVLNICEEGTETVLGMPLAQAKHRLRGFFCKTAALLLAPFDEVMLVDLDVVWFQKPDRLFDAPAYQRTGALFFRDRTTYSEQRSKDKISDPTNFQNRIEEFMMKYGDFEITEKFAQEQAIANGHSFFWQNPADPEREAPCLNNFQDSSVVLFDKSRHPRTVEILEEILPDFNLGYGDKEIYWMATTIAQEPFSFEPFLNSHYGNCGLLMHYDPNYENDPKNAQPFYMNAEWLLEKIHILGHDLEFERAAPVPVTTGMEIPNMSLNRRCLCSWYECLSIPEEVNHLLLQAQWERFSRNMSKKGPDKDCMPIWKDVAGLISEGVVKKHIEKGWCDRFGCTNYPIVINEQSMDQKDFCDPVSFKKNPDMAQLAALEAKRQEPNLPPAKDGDLLTEKDGAKIYIYKDGAIHLVPSVGALAAMGKSVKDVRQVGPDITHFKMGDPVVIVEENYTPKPVDFLMTPTSATIYLYLEGVKHGIPTWETMTAMGKTMANVHVIPSDQLEAIPLGQNVAGDFLTEVVATINPGAVMHIVEGAIVRVKGETKVYLYEEGGLRHIPDIETFESMHRAWDEVLEVSEEDLHTIPIGPPLPSVNHH